MTPNEIDLAAHQMRTWLQEHTCCPSHAADVLLLVLAGFTLDDADDNVHEAAATLKRVSRDLAERIRKGEIAMARMAS